MLNIRLNRVGRKNKAYFRVVVQEHTVAPGGRHVEVVGSYDPHAKKTVLKADRITHWMSQGAQLSNTVHNLLVREGVIEGKKIAVKMKRPVKAEAEVKTEEAAA
jgi:small subunit ribosomal protein S16